MLRSLYGHLAVVQTVLWHRTMKQNSQLSRKKQKGFWFSLIVTAIIVSGCANNPPIDASERPTALPPSDPSIFFLRQRPIEGERETMMAMLSGELIMVGDCLRVNDMNSNASYLLVWPPDFTADSADGAVQIYNGKGQTLVQVGDKILVDGGEVNKDMVTDYLEQPLPDKCSGPYWIVGNEVGLAEDTD